MVRFSVSMVSSWNVSLISSASIRSLKPLVSLMGRAFCCANLPLLQAMAESHAFVEHKTFAAPAALALRYAFEVAQDAALEVVDFGKPLREQIGAGLFAADAAGAEHRDLPVFCRIEVARG